MRRRSLPPPAALGFLLPNFLGFLAFTLFPVLLSLWMAFTNWSLKPAVHLQFVGLRNFTDLLGVRPLDAPQPGLAGQYLGAVAWACYGVLGALWAVVARWPGTRLGGALIGALGCAMAAGGLVYGGGQGVATLGLALLLLGAAGAWREGTSWRLGWGTMPAAVLMLGVFGIYAMNGAMWRAYEPNDIRFWQYFYNTAYLMIGMPFAIAGSLALALLLNESLPFGSARARATGAGLCLACAALTLMVVWSLGAPNAALLGAILWAVAAAGIAFNVVAFRTIFYLPTFTAGVALMILWKALYNPDTGPINAALAALMHLTGLHAEPPKWLGDVAWAKPAMIFMGIWTAIGGTNMLLYLAGLSNVPPELLDAAQVDGAGPWNRFRHVLWPQLAPTTFFITVMSIIGGLQGGFEQARVLTNGGPAGSTTTLSFYIYNKAFQDLDLGYAAAISWALFAVIFVATAINWKHGRELEVEA